jgi:MFS family permease
VFTTDGADPCNASAVLFTVNSSSPVPNAVESGYKACAASGSYSTGIPEVVANGVDSGKILWGDMITLYLAFYAGGLFFAGHIGDKMNLKLFLILGMVGTSVTVALTGLGFYFSITTSCVLLPCMYARRRCAAAFDAARFLRCASFRFVSFLFRSFAFSCTLDCCFVFCAPSCVSTKTHPRP